jgi:multidrug efflux pump subunit AcrA (membrane-fusion protein)
VTELLLQHGERAEAGQALARIAAIDRVLVHGTLRGARPDELHRLSFARARTLTGGVEVDLVAAGAVLLSTPLVVDPRSGGLEVSWSVPNDGRLLIGELVELTVGLGEPVERLTVPLSAVVEVNTRPQAFVQLTGESFEQRRLELGVSDGERVEVLSGLSADDLVVTQGGFEVYVASIAGSVESHRH